MNQNKFHEHLDHCQQCRNHPFGLCPVGTALILECAGNMQVVDKLPADFQHVQVQHIAPLREITRWRNN